MVVETRKPMNCPYCGEQVILIQIDEWDGSREEGIVDPEAISSTNAGLTYQLHECKGE